jgi:hypothetical protein
LDKGPSVDDAFAVQEPKGVQSLPPLPKGMGGSGLLRQEQHHTSESFQLNNGSTNSTLPEQAQASVEGDARPYFLDIFCGTAGVAAALKRYGAEALGVDHIIDKRRMKGPAVKMDLTLSSSQQLVFEELKSGRVKGVMLAPPCGTSSKARNIPIRGPKGKLRRGPPPLRSASYPEGIPGLQGVNRTRVRHANKLYKFCSEVMRLCDELGILCIVENLNPVSSGSPSGCGLRQKASNGMLCMRACMGLSV